RRSILPRKPMFRTSPPGVREPDELAAGPRTQSISVASRDLLFFGSTFAAKGFPQTDRAAREPGLGDAQERVMVSFLRGERCQHLLHQQSGGCGSDCLRRLLIPEDLKHYPDGIGHQVGGYLTLGAV